MAPNTLRIGVDVGGTNTDGVLLDPLLTSDSTRGILSWEKTPTTTDPSDGIESVIKTLLSKAQVNPNQIASVTIGTTHFINAVIEKDQNRLAPVAVIRLSGPFSHDVYPGIDWSPVLRSIICKYYACIDGGIEVDGQVIADISESQIEEQCKIIKEKGIKSIVVNGIFSPSDLVERQEERAAEWAKKYYPEADVVVAKQVANLGFIERENAAILNASILPFARRTIASFQAGISKLKLTCPVFLTQNDGTILPAHLAAQLPVRTFLSGPTNSMCGAAFLVRNEVKKESMLVVDIGGTTTDVGMLLPSGLPRQAASVTEIASIRVNFSCPDVKSIGLGGGSIVRRSDSTQKMAIGPDSVGLDIQSKALVFGGHVPTATDYAVASNPKLSIGDRNRVGSLSEEDKTEYAKVVREMLENIVDRMKTNADDIPVLLVGGGVLIAPDTLKGASHVIKPEHAGVANAIGAAIAKVSGTIDITVSTQDKKDSQVLEEVALISVERAVENGAIRNTVQTVEMDLIPLPYAANKARVIVKSVGDFDLSGSFAKFEEITDTEFYPTLEKDPLLHTQPSDSVSIDCYRPHITASREWIISPLDLEFISTGCYILGTGGGGNPYALFIQLREKVIKGAVVKVISPEDVQDDAVIASGGGMGSPTVLMEKLPANEIMEAQNMVYQQIGRKPDAVIAIEIGGGNGLQGMLLGASCNMNIPTVDGDWMGRAYPTTWQITPVVHAGDGAHFLPAAISDGNGNQVLMTASRSAKMVERTLRGALTEMGSAVGFANGPCSGANMKSWVIPNTISLAWRIGRAIAMCRSSSQIDDFADFIINEVGGPSSARVLFKGKIVGVERRTAEGFVYGQVIVQAAEPAEEAGEGAFKGKLIIPFQNENLVATAVDEDGVEKVVASVPDLICVCDANSGEAIGTPEYRYGLFVTIIGITASERWTSTQRGIEMGGPRAFGMDIEYEPLGISSKPMSVIDDYGWRPLQGD